jgi:hypothetical protein
VLLFLAAPAAACLVSSGALREANGEREEDDLDREHQTGEDRIEALRCLRELARAEGNRRQVRQCDRLLREMGGEEG